MRRYLCVFLILAILLARLPAAAEDADVSALAVWNGRLLAAGPEGVACLALPDGERALSPLPEGEPLAFVPAGEEMCLLSAGERGFLLDRLTRSGALLPAPERVRAFDPLLEGELSGAAALGRELYLCGLDQDFLRAVWRVDMKSGEARPEDALAGVERLCALGSDRLLLLSGGEDGRFVLSAWDGARREPLFSLPEAVRETPEWLLAADGEAWFLSSGNLWRADLSSGEARPLFTVSRETRAAAFWPGRGLVLAGPGGLRWIDPDADDWVLRVYDDFSSEDLARTAALFEEENPGARVLLEGDLDLGADELLRRFLGRDAPWDALLLPFSSPALSALMERGYVCPLGPAANALAAGMYPLVRERVAPEGAALCVPLEVSARVSLGVSRAGLARIGLAPEDLPASWEGLLSWMGETLPSLLPEGMSAFPAFMPASTWRRGLFESILTDWEEYRRRADPDPGYDAPELLRLLELLDRLDWDALGNGGTERSPEVDESSFLFEPVGVCLVESAGRLPLALTPVEGVSAAVYLEGGALIVNPASERLDAALAFADAACACISPQSRRALSPEESGGVANGPLLPAIGEARAEVSRLEAALAEADGSARQSLADALAAARREAEALEAEAWIVSPEALAWYRGHDGRVLPRGEDIGLILNQREMNMLRAGYLAGELSPARFLASLQEKRSMQLAEGGF